MTRYDVFQAVACFLAVLEADRVFEDREAALRSALDRLAMAYQFANAPFDPTHYLEDVASDYAAARGRIAALFPGVGFYNEAIDLVGDVGASEMGVGDAIDDLVDIAVEMNSVLASWKNTSEEHALWRFRFGFETHWGRHLRSLQLYLHERAF